MSEQPDLEAGDFSTWLCEMQAAIRGERASDVPCNGCTSCCTSSQFIPIGPDETDTLARIPDELLFPAPRLPPGHVLLGYDERGHCPMLINNQCSIYEDRPRTCRTYDCRIFPAAGVHDDDKPQIATQSRRWRFTYASEADRAQHDATRAAAKFVNEHGAPANATQLAVQAIEIHEPLVGRDPSPDMVTAEVRRVRRPAHGDPG